MNFRNVKYVIAVDIGTTSTKSMVIDQDGSIYGQQSTGYSLESPFPGQAEQDPDVLYEAVIASVNGAIQSAGINTDDILCVSFSSAMHSLIAIDEGLAPLTQSITWADNRAVRQADRLKEGHAGLGIYLRTGTPLHPMSPLTKLIWLRENCPTIFAKAAWFIGIKEYVIAKLFGKLVIDYSIASATGLFNLSSLIWDTQALQLAGITADRLSEPVPTTYRLDGVNPAEAARMGISEATPFIVGASDGTLANLGVGAFEPNVFAVTVGTSGAVRAVVNKPITDPKGRLFCYALTEKAWVVGGAVNNGGILLRWVRDVLATKEAEAAKLLNIDPYTYLIELASGVSAGSDGLIMLPMLTGERAPHWNADARGVFFGLSLTHGKPHMIRAVLEGVIYGLNSVAKALADMVGPSKEIRASGGFAQSVPWLQMLADVWGVPLSVPATIESSCVGAAYLGFMGMNEKQGFEGIHQWVKTGTLLQAQQENHLVYQKLFPLYEQIYDRLKEPFTEISQFQNDRRNQDGSI